MQKKFKQFFAKDFAGIDGESTPLEPDSGGVNRAVNLECAVGNSLRGRVGGQVSGQPGQFFAIFPYTYTRTQNQYDIVYDAGNTLSTTKTTADGATINKLIGLNGQMWVRDTMSIPITRNAAAATPITWYSTVSGANINFVMKCNGSAVVNQSMGDGVSTSTSIRSLLSTVDATTEFNVSVNTRGTCPPFAIVNGNQTTTFVAAVSLGNTYSVTVNNTPHTFYPGDVITFPGLIGGIVVDRTATTITYLGYSVTLNNGDVLGYQGQEATGFEIDVAQSASPAIAATFNVSFPYWRLIPEGDNSDYAPLSYGAPFGKAFLAWSGRAPNSFYAPAVATNASGCLYIASSCDPTPASGSKVSSLYSNNLVKTDGSTLVRAGLPEASMVVAAPGAGALTGIYKYKVYLKRVDAQGNIVEGPLSSVTSITYAANYGGITVSFPTYNAGTGDYGFQTRGCYKDTTEAPAAGVSFRVDNGTANTAAIVQPGDPIVLTDNVAQKVGLWHFAFGVDALGTLHRTVCTFYDGTAAGPLYRIKVEDSSGYTIPNNSEISTGLTAVVLRTAAGGNAYYELAELPVTGYGTVSFFDNVTDAVLTTSTQFAEPDIGKEHDAPPRCSLVCQHQGGLVVARDFRSPNTVAFSTAAGIEYFPTASNSFDVPATQSGAITAIASDTNDRLAVFKDRAYYDIVGDLDAGAFSVNVRQEGDFGVSSQASLVRVQDILMGVCKNGFVAVSDGTLSWKPFSGVNTRLINQSYYFNWATACNDTFGRNYTCAIPTASSPVIFSLDYSKETPKWFERSYASLVDPAGGLVSLGNDLFWLSQSYPYAVFRRLRRFSGDSPGNGDGDSFIDNTQAISYILETNPITNNEPDVLNTPIRLRLWSLPNDYVKEGWVPFSTTVETASSAFASFIGGSNPGATTSIVSFAADTNGFKDVKLVSHKTSFYLVRLTTNTVRTSPFWSGFEILYAESYKPEDLIK